MSFKRILIAVEASEIAIHATGVGLDLASTLDAEVAFIHVIAPTISDGAWVAVPPPEFALSNTNMISQVLASLGDQTKVPQTAPKFIPVGLPVESIVQVARDWSADLVVVGSHGRDGIGRVLLGSVAEGVVRYAPCPVLVVRNRA